MNNKWKKTCEDLKDLLKILICSNCQKNAHDHQQRLNCGHISYISCINNNDKVTCCTMCQLCDKNTILKDDMVNNIVASCCMIVHEVSLDIDNRTVGNASSCINESLSEQTNNNNSINILKKRKISVDSKENAKKIKHDKFTTKPLMSIGKNLNKVNHFGETKLQEETKKGNKEKVQYLLEAGADPNVSCYAHWTPLQESADYNFYEITEMLLKAGADVDKQGREGRRALHNAVMRNNLEIVKLLLEYNPRQDLTDNNEKKPIDYCQTEEMRELLCSSIEKSIQHNIQTISNNKVSESTENVYAGSSSEQTTDKEIKTEISHLKNEISDLKNKILHSKYNDMKDEIEIVYENIKEEKNIMQPSTSKLL